MYKNSPDCFPTLSENFHFFSLLILSHVSSPYIPPPSLSVSMFPLQRLTIECCRKPLTNSKLGNIFSPFF